MGLLAWARLCETVVRSGGNGWSCNIAAEHEGDAFSPGNAFIALQGMWLAPLGRGYRRLFYTLLEYVDGLIKAKVAWDWGCLGREYARKVIRCIGFEKTCDGWRRRHGGRCTQAQLWAVPRPWLMVSKVAEASPKWGRGIFMIILVQFKSKS